MKNIELKGMKTKKWLDAKFKQLFPVQIEIYQIIDYTWFEKNSVYLYNVLKKKKLKPTVQSQVKVIICRYKNLQMHKYRIYN